MGWSWGSPNLINWLINWRMSNFWTHSQHELWNWKWSTVSWVLLLTVCSIAFYLCKARGTKLTLAWPLNAYPCPCPDVLCEILLKLELPHFIAQVDLQLSNMGNGELLFLTSIDSALSALVAAIVGTCESPGRESAVSTTRLHCPHSGSNQLWLESTTLQPRHPWGVLSAHGPSRKRWLIRNLLHNNPNLFHWAFLWRKHKLWLSGKARIKVRVSLKSLEFILLGSWISKAHSAGIWPLVFEICCHEPKCYSKKIGTWWWKN